MNLFGIRNIRNISYKVSINFGIDYLTITGVGAATINPLHSIPDGSLTKCDT